MTTRQRPQRAADVRDRLAELLRLDLVGPEPGEPTADEALPEPPWRWYLTGMLAPGRATAETRQAEEDVEDIAAGDDRPGEGDAGPAETVAKQAAPLPSSLGLTVLVPGACAALEVEATWGEYAAQGPADPARPAGEVAADDASAGAGARWQRSAHRHCLRVPLDGGTGPVFAVGGAATEVHLRVVVRPAPDELFAPALVPVRAVSLFLVNDRGAANLRERGARSLYQARLDVSCEAGFVGRPNPRGRTASDEFDERVGDLQYHDVHEFVVGHNVAAMSSRDGGRCQRVRSAWIPSAEIARVVPRDAGDVEVAMEALAAAPSAAALRAALAGLPEAYAAWIQGQRGQPAGDAQRANVSETLLDGAERALARIRRGLGLLDDPDLLAAFQLANRAMAAAARRRRPGDAPRWRLFQLAFVLMNLEGVATPGSAEREIVDLLFFPTGGGKTEAYLGLAALELALRRLRHPGIAGAGVTVIMRYTLRLLTIDQLARAAAVVCALELERLAAPERWGPWPFEIGLWVGRSGTPNRMGSDADRADDTARAKALAFRRDDRNPANSPIPLQSCPWCQTPFRGTSFRLWPDERKPTELRVVCANAGCDFTRDRALPIVAVDEPLLRRLPAFIIATVDKFAALPWNGRVGALFGRVDRYDGAGFYGPCDPGHGLPLPQGRLPPPSLIIQDELHLISGPLGTVAGLYEAAIEALCTVGAGETRIRPKIVASTATVRRANAQIRALFGRDQVCVFPPPGPDRDDAFFAQTATDLAATPGRRYLGIAAPGRSPKLVLLRVYLTLLAAGRAAWEQAGGRRRGEAAPPFNPADPYTTLLGYFSSLRELGGSRRIVEDEVASRAAYYSRRAELGPLAGAFADRNGVRDVHELTSRVPTATVAETRERLGLPYGERNAISVALATNMISVGLDISRLGLMVVLGQPKTSAEYIQATSRVGRERDRPGLVVTIFNPTRPRDRSHYERFEHYHATFYRAVEATSVTPFSPRALDRALAATVVGLARHLRPAMTPPDGAREILGLRASLEEVAVTLRDRARMVLEGDADPEAAQTVERVRHQAGKLLDDWHTVAERKTGEGSFLTYDAREDGVGGAPLLHAPLDPAATMRPADERRFRAAWSMRSVEPAVHIRVRGARSPEDQP